MIKSECLSKKEQCMPEMYVNDDGEKYKIKNMSVKNAYRRLIGDV